jgi:16S rRNA (guanine966-N2)-methyltransferase
VPARGTRPTTDRVREALFNVLAARRDFDGLRVLDLYAGSGALGLEALSRGAESALFVESDSRAVAVIKRNVEALGLRGATVRRGVVASVLSGAPDKPMDLVLADPPYEVSTAEIEGLLHSLARNGWLDPDAVVVIERPASSTEISWPAGWTAWDNRRYGDTRVELASC